MLKGTILVVGGPGPAAEALTNMLIHHDFRIDLAQSKKEGIFLLSLNEYALIILFYYFTRNHGGPAFITQIRMLSYAPILLILQDMSLDITDALIAGADCYADLKTAGESNLVALSNALIRRYTQYSGVKQCQKILYLASGLRLSLVTKRLFVNGHIISLTPLEFKFLRLLFINPNRLMTYRVIFETVWEGRYNKDADSLIWKMVHRLRQKLKPYTDLSEIENIYGRGYRYKP